MQTNYANVSTELFLGSEAIFKN